MSCLYKYKSLAFLGLFLAFSFSQELAAQKERPGANKARPGATRANKEYKPEETLEPAETTGEHLGEFLVPVEYDAMFDYQFLPRSGGQSLTGLMHLPYSFFSDKSNRPNRRKGWRIALRSAKLLLLDLPVADYYNNIQGAVFGTGSYARLLGRDSIQYRVRPFSFFNRSKVEYSVEQALGQGLATLDEELAISIASIEATGAVMPEVLRQQFVTGGRMSHEMSMLYVVSKVSQLRQILGARNDLSNRAENNIERYVYNLNAKYSDSSVLALGTGALDSFRYSMGAIKAKSLISVLLDPTLAASLFNLYGFVLDAKKLQRSWSLKLGKWQYTPSFNLGFTPFGDEIHFHSYLVDPKFHVYHIKLRIGNNPYEQGVSWAASANMANYRWQGVGVFQAQGEIWNQPAFAFAQSDASIRSVGGGVGGMFMASFRSEPLFQSVGIRIYGNVGYKSAGYTTGENLDQSFIFRVGLSYPDFFSKDRKTKKAEVSNKRNR